MSKPFKYSAIFILIIGLLFPSSAFATSGYSYKDSQSSFLSFLFSFTSSKGGSYDWNHDDGKDHWGDKDRDKDWEDDDWKDWDGCLRDKKNSSKCVESKDVWHDWYCGIKGDHNHGDADNDKDDYDWYDKDEEKYS